VPSQRDPELPPGAPRCRLIGSICVAGALETVEKQNSCWGRHPRSASRRKQRRTRWVRPSPSGWDGVQSASVGARRTGECLQLFEMMRGHANRWSQEAGSVS
jgi:hypothetical protein